ncbi:hypothetical protein P3447_08105 [Vibrio parahaemolyticus]|nr:hypothetical protein [Vibrio parahaemolyticus]
MKFELVTGKSLFLVTVCFYETAMRIGGGQGLSDTIHVYVVADSKADAEEMARKHHQAQQPVRMVDGFKTMTATVNTVNRAAVLGWTEGVRACHA